MTGTTEAIQGVAGLLFGGFLFVVFGTALSRSAAIDPIVDLRLWGLIYIVVALVLAAGAIYTTFLAIVN